MGCCSSLPDRDEGETVTQRQTIETTQQQQQQQQQEQQTHIKKPEVTITRASSSLHSVNAEKTSGSYNMTTTTTTVTTSSSSPPPPSHTEENCPIFVRLSNNGQDITISVPTQPPYLTVGGLRKELLPHLEKNARVKLIYLGRILPDGHVIVPTMTTDADVPLPPPKNRAIQIQKEGVIQAMVTRG